LPDTPDQEVDQGSHFQRPSLDFRINRSKVERGQLICFSSTPTIDETVMSELQGRIELSRLKCRPLGAKTIP